MDGGGRTIPLETGGWQNFRGTDGPKRIENYSSGGPHAARKAITDHYPAYLQDIADELLTTGPARAMEGVVEDMADAFRDGAPRVTGSYHESTARIVTDNGSLSYERYGQSYGEEPR